MKNKRDGYYGRSRSREGSSDRRRSSRSRRRSRSSREKSEYRSMTRSRSRERYSRKSKRSRSSSSSSSGSSSSSSRSRSRKSSPYHDSNNRRPVDKGGFPFTLPASGQFGGEAPRPGGAPWFDGNRGGVPGGVPPPAPPPPPAAFPPPPHRTPPAPPPPSIDLTSPMPPPAPTFDSRPIPSIQHEEPRNFPPPNFPAEDPGRFGNNFQGNFPSGYDVPYYPPGTNVGQYPPSGPNPPHNFNPAEHQPPNSNWNFPQGGMPQQLGPPPFKEAPNGPPPAAQPPSKEAIEHSKKEAVEQELAQQKRTLAVQREEYFKRKITLTRELTRLKDQKRELINEDSSVNDRILKENSKLQGEILNKLKSMDNVIEMLSNIIGDKAEIAELMKETSYAVGSPKSNDKRKRSMSRSPGRSKAKNKSKSPVARGEKPVNIVHYDPELHWCSVCDVFPRTVTQYLSHLHSEGHQQELKNKKKGKKEEELMPWRTRENREPSPPRFKNAPNKRVPLRGVQFLVPSTAWYCSMCKVWLGDMDAATRHLKAPKHASIYHEFTIQNPHWEVDWLTERTRAYERNSDAKSKSQSAIKEDASPRKSAPNANEEPKTEKSAPPTAALDMANFGDRLLAMLAASSKSNLIAAQKEHKKEKKERKSSSSSGSSSESDYEKKKKKKKRKKEEKKKRKGDRENRRDESSKGKKHDDDEKESEDRSMKKRYPNKLDDRPVAPRDWDSEPPDRSNRGRSNSKPQQFSKDFRTGPKNVKAGPEFSERDFLGPGKNAAHDSRISSREDSYYGPKEPPKIDEVIRAAREKERKEEEKRPKGKLYVPGRDDNDGGGKKQEKETKRESSVDKKSSDSAVKKKDVMKPFSIPKAKLPFIGRMPILKKKIDPKPAEPEVPKPQPATEEVDQPPIPKSKFSNAEPVEESAKTDEAAGLPKSTLIISMRPPMSEPEVAMKIDNLQEQDMEIEDDSAPPPPPPPPPPKDEPAAPKVSAEENPAAEGSELHKDFKDALDLLFPEQKTEEEPEPEPEPVQLTESEQVTLSTTSAPPQTYQQPTNYNMYQQSGAPSYDNMGYYDQTAAYHHHMQQQQMSYMAAMGYDQSNMNMFPPAGPPPNYGMQQMYPPPAMMAPQMNSGYPQGMDVIPPLPVEPPAEHPPGMGYHPQNSDQSSSEAAEETAPPKKKNAPGQRLRRHFRKKAMQAEALKEAQPAAEGETAEDDDAQNPMTLPSPKPAKLRPEDLSELALLGIEEGDITAQSFY